MQVMIDAEGRLVFCGPIPIGRTKALPNEQKLKEIILKLPKKEGRAAEYDKTIVLVNELRRNPRYSTVHVIGGSDITLTTLIGVWSNSNSGVRSKLGLLSDGSFVFYYSGRLRIPSFAKEINAMPPVGSLFEVDSSRFFHGSLAGETVQEWQLKAILGYSDDTILESLSTYLARGFTQGLQSAIDKLNLNHGRSYDGGFFALAVDFKLFGKPVADYFVTPNNSHLWYQNVFEAFKDYFLTMFSDTRLADIPEPPNYGIYQVSVVDILRSHLIKSKLKEE